MEIANQLKQLLGGNLLCLELWSGSQQCGLQIHCIHFFYAFGAFVAPLVAAPFLSRRSGAGDVNGSHQRDDVDDETHITVLYPVIGICTALASCGYWHFHVKEDDHLVTGSKTVPTFVQPMIRRLNNPFPQVLINSHVAPEPSPSSELNRSHSVIGILFSLFLFLYVGMEYCYGTYLAAFAVDSRLHLSRAEGARLTALFWGSFSFMRFLAIFASTAVRPVLVLGGSFIVCFVGSVAAALWGEESKLGELVLDRDHINPEAFTLQPVTHPYGFWGPPLGHLLVHGHGRLGVPEDLHNGYVAKTISAITYIFTRSISFACFFHLNFCSDIMVRSSPLSLMPVLCLHYLLI